MPNPPSHKEKPLIKSQEEAISLVSEALAKQGLEPELIPNDKIGSLRSNVVCFNLSNLEGIDAAVVITVNPVRYYRGKNSPEKFYRIDYAVKGTVRQVPPGRLLALATPKTKGLITKNVVGVSWVTPYSTMKPKAPTEPNFDGQPPVQGEVGEGSPYHKLIGMLNNDERLTELMVNYLNLVGELSVSVLSDPWGESLRITGTTGFGTYDLIDVYASLEYVRIANEVCLRLKELRKTLGGVSY